MQCSTALSQDLCDKLTASLVSTLPYGVLLLTRDGKILGTNMAAVTILGVTTHTDLLDHTLLSFPFFEPITQVIKESLEKPFQTILALENDKSIEVTITLLPPIVSPEQYIVISFHDASRRVRLDKDLKDYARKLNEEQMRLLSAINSLSMGFIIIDRKNNLLIKNDVLNEILDLHDLEGNIFLKGDSEIIEKKLSASYPLRDKWEKAMIERITIVDRDVVYVDRYLRIVLSPIIIPNEEAPMGVVILIEDMTEAKVMERSREEFFSIASHELRTPLTAIRGNCSMIKQFYGEKIKAEADLNEMIEDIHESSVRLIGIVNDFLDTSRLEQRRMQFQIEAFDITELITSVIDEFKAASALQNVNCILAPPSEALPKVVADKNKVKQILINLVGNSLKFTEQGAVTVSPAVINGMVQVSVSDTGRGIPKENQHLLFRKFQQAGNSLFTRDTVKGTGLGLYISKLMIEGMKGKIWLVSSEEGKGTTFAFTLPLADSSTPQPPPPATQ